MEPRERTIAGLRCSDVLVRLSDFIDDELEPQAREQVVAHLRGCDWCERFGGRFGAVISDLRKNLREPEPLSREIADRLRDAINRNRGE